MLQEDGTFLSVSALQVGGAGLKVILDNTFIITLSQVRLDKLRLWPNDIKTIRKLTS